MYTELLRERIADCESVWNSLPCREASPDERQRLHRSVIGIYDKMKAAAVACPYKVRCGDVELMVLPNVYAPGFFTDSGWFSEQVHHIVGDRSFLEIGTGTGIIAIHCARRGARVVATDINPDAVHNARLNCAYHNLSVSIRQGSLFEPLEPHEKFDYVFWAHPFNNWETPVHDILLRSGMDYKYEGLRGYIEDARRHLTQKGRLLLGTGDTADLRTVVSVAAENRYRPKVIARRTMPLEIGSTTLITYLLCEFVPGGDQ